MISCVKCGSRLGDDHVAEIAFEMAELSEGSDTIFRVRARLRQLALMLVGQCASCAHHAAQRGWHRCKRCPDRKVYAPATRCDLCNGELWGIKEER